MVRTLVIGVLGLALFAGIAYNLGLFRSPPSGETNPNKKTEFATPDLGADLYRAMSMEGFIQSPTDTQDEDPILFSGQLTVFDRQEVPSLIEGSIQYIGEEIPVGAQLVGGIACFLPEPCYVTKVKIPISLPGGKWIEQDNVYVYRRLMKGDVVEKDQILAGLNTGKAITDKRTKVAKVQTAIADYQAAKLKADTYQAIYERSLHLSQVQKGAISPQELAIAKATWESGAEESKAKLESIKEARANLDQTQLYLNQHSILNQIPTRTAVIKEISKVLGEGVKPGDKVMELQSLDKFLAEGRLEVQYIGRVRVGMNATVIPSQEEAPRGRPLKFHRAEVNSVAFTNRGLPGSNVPLIVSGSEDQSVLLWDRRFSAPLGLQLQFKDPVRVVACSPQGSAHNLILAGCADGSIYLWDLDNKHQKTPHKIPADLQPHSEPITSLAFSPDGKFFASGSESASIKLWNIDAIRSSLAAHHIAAKIKNAKESVPADELESSLQLLARSDSAKDLVDAMKSGDLDKAGRELEKLHKERDVKELVYPFDAEHGVMNPHYGAITSLHFTPQCQLVSASRDNTVRVWALKQNGVEPVGFPIPGRKGDVSQLGVSGDGNYMLFDQGKTIQILSVKDGRTINTLQTPGNTVDFQTTAIFSPDGSLMLTAGAAEGRLQLWSTPSGSSRGFEVRQYVSDERSPVTCAAFAPQAVGDRRKGSLAVSGTKDGFVYLWPVPSADEVENHPIRDVTLTSVYPDVDSSTRHIRLAVEVRNQFSPQYPQGRLVPGRFVTIVIRN
jgi:WD40 repeat protein